jgi:hypothetical protein
VSTVGRVLLRDIVDMLKKCAPGAELVVGKHKIRVLWNGRVYPNLPKGAHGRRPGREEIQRGEVRDLVTFFGIEDCARGQLEILR